MLLTLLCMFGVLLVLLRLLLQLGMEDGDVIDCFMEQIGGGSARQDL